MYDNPENTWEFPRQVNFNWLRKKAWKRYTYNGEPVKEQDVKDSKPKDRRNQTNPV